MDRKYKGRGIAKQEGLAMNKVNEVLGLRMFGSISPKNPASLAVAKAVNEIKILETLGNGDLYIEFLPLKKENSLSHIDCVHERGCNTCSQ